MVYSLLMSVLPAVALALVLYVLVRVHAPLWTFLLPLVVVVVPQLRPEWATYWHGFMHSSLVYAIVERGIPPQNPLMVGEPLRYMYGHHVLIAWLMRVVPISPPQAFALTDLLSLVALALVMDRVARLVSEERSFRVFAVLMAFVAFVPLASGFVRGPLEHVLRTELEWRFIPLTKFTGINDNQLGLVLFAIDLLGVSLLAETRAPRRSAFVLIGVAIVGAGYIYPPAWVGIMACTGLASLYFVWRGHEMRRAGITLLAILFVGAVVTAPFIYVLTAGKSSAAAVHLWPSIRTLKRHIVNLILFASVPVLLGWLARERLLDWWRRQPELVVVLALGAGITMFLYGVMTIPAGAEYKLLGMSVIVLSVPVAIAVHDFYERHQVLSLGVLVLLVLPVGGDFGRLWVHEPVSDPVVSDGRWLRHADARQDSLYSWIAHDTPVDALFVDTYLTIPILGRRQLLVGIDERRESGGLTGVMHDGWLITARQFLRANTGVPDAKLKDLQGIARTLVSSTPDSTVSDRTLDELSRYSAGRPVYVVARSDAVLARLDTVPEMHVAYRGSAGTVYRFIPRPSGGGLQSSPGATHEGAR